MGCCQTEGIEELMDEKVAARDLNRYRRKGPSRTTRMLMNTLKQQGISDTKLLDIGGGVGAIQHELLRAGVAFAISVDASSAYLKSAREEAERLGQDDRLHQMHGDFVELAKKVPRAEIVTMDKVICCYDDMDKLVRRSAEHALKLYGVIYPRDHGLTRAFTWLQNQYHRIRGSQYRAFAHSTAAVEALILGAGLNRIFSGRTLFWQLHVYRRS
jgi:predicted TPR repeat methyltransferase